MVNDKVNGMASVIVNHLLVAVSKRFEATGNRRAPDLTILSFVQFMGVVASRVAVCSAIASSFLMP